jgi:hypothetical protein
MAGEAFADQVVCFLEKFLYKLKSLLCCRGGVEYKRLMGIESRHNELWSGVERYQR